MEGPKTNSTTPALKGLPYSTPRALAKVCGTLFSRNLVLRDPAQLKPIYLSKGNKSQLTWVL